MYTQCFGVKVIVYHRVFRESQCYTYLRNFPYHFYHCMFFNGIDFKVLQSTSQNSFNNACFFVPEIFLILFFHQCLSNTLCRICLYNVYSIQYSNKIFKLRLYILLGAEGSVFFKCVLGN
jgi:hypothetical protein